MLRTPSSSLRRTAAFLFALGATYGTFLDWLHYVSGTLRYANPWIWGQAPWVPALFGSAAVALGVGRRVAGHVADAAPEPVTGAKVLGAGFFFTACYAISAFTPDAWALGLLVPAAIVSVVWLDPSRAGLVNIIGPTLVGPLVEITLIRLGGFEYVDADGPLFVWGIPVWLPFLYVVAAASVGAMSRWVGRGL